MSAYSEQDPRHIVIQQTLESLLETGAVNSLEYGFVNLSGPGLTEFPEPGIDYTILNATAYWPGGIVPGVFSERFALFSPLSRGEVSGDNMIEEIGLTFDAVMKGRLGNAALNDPVHGPNSMRSKYFAEKLENRYVSKFMELAMMNDAPLSLVTLSEATPQSETSGPMERIATLYFPAGGPAKECLRYLNTSVARLAASNN